MDARNSGLEIAVDTIPLSSGHFVRKDRFIHFLMALSPSLFGCSPDEVVEFLRTIRGREKVIQEAEYILKGGGKDFVLVRTGDTRFESRTVNEIAEELKASPADLLLQMLADEHREFTINMGGKESPNFPNKPHDKSIIDNPYVMVGSDMLYVENGDPYAWYEQFRRGAFPVFFNMYKSKGIAIEEIIRRGTSFPAEQFRLGDRGLLKEGYAADISVLDPEGYKYTGFEEMDRNNPLGMAEGVKYVLINGKITVEDGAINRSYSGKVLKIKGRE